MALRRSSVERVVAPLRASEAMRAQLKQACRANCARNATAEDEASALQAQLRESPLARWRRAGAAALVCSLSTPQAAEADEGSEGEAAAAARLLEVSLLADAAEAEVAQRELGRRIAMRVGSKQVKAMRNSDATRRQIQAEVLAERDSAQLPSATPSLHDRAADGTDTPPRETTEPGVCVCVCVRACVSVCVCLYIHTYASVC